MNKKMMIKEWLEATQMEHKDKSGDADLSWGYRDTESGVFVTAALAAKYAEYRKEGTTVIEGTSPIVDVDAVEDEDTVIDAVILNPLVEEFKDGVKSLMSTFISGAGKSIKKAKREALEVLESSFIQDIKEIIESPEEKGLSKKDLKNIKRIAKEERKKYKKMFPKRVA